MDFTYFTYVPADLVIGAYRSQQVYVLRYGICVYISHPKHLWCKKGAAK